MRRTALLLGLFLIFLTGCTPTRSVDEWVNIPVKDGSFSVQMPGEPTFSEKKIARTDGDANVFSYTYQNPAAQYRVTILGLPKPPSDPNIELDAAAKSLAEMPDRVETTTMGGKPARIVEAVSSTGEFIFARLILSEDRLYSLVAKYSRTAIRKNVAERAAKFFDSFMLAP